MPDTPETPDPVEPPAALPEDLAELSDEALVEIETALLAEFNEIYDPEAVVSAEGEARLAALHADILRLRTEAEGRAEQAESRRAEADRMAAEIRGPEDEEDGGDGTDDGGDAETAPEPEAELVVTASAPARIPARDALKRLRPQLNVPLSEIARHAPPAQLQRLAPRMTITAAADVPGFGAGQEIGDLTAIALAAHLRSRNLPTTTLGHDAPTYPVASIHREFPVTMSPDSQPEEAWALMEQAARPEALVAAGGWCAPSLPIYEFFNISCNDGILDLPTVGVERGGIRFPTSPSIADVFGNIFLWTETDDILAVTGTGVKPCFRPPCPTFTEERWDCHGHCVTSGNLTDEAFPELIANFLRLTMNASDHVQNLRRIADIVSQSVTVTGTGQTADSGVVAPVLGNVDLQAADYREKYRMCDDDVLEVIFPRWIRGAMRSDIAKRNGIDPSNLGLSEQAMRDWFDVRSVRVQFVSDWQLTAFGLVTPATTWPANVQFLIYAAGTFVLGPGPRLDIAVLRDSVLNAKNDHTAAFVEECWLIAKFGHESRLVTVDICADGTTGVQVDLGCGP